jgi:competence protein ComEA
MRGCCTHSVFRWSISLLALAAAAQQLPDGAGKADIEKRCIGCHEVARSVSLRQDRAGWSTTIAKMTSLGMKASDKELESMLDYLSHHFPADAVPPVHINKARAIDIESRLGLRRSQAAAIIRHRSEHGDFKTIEDLKKVPGVDAADIENKKDRIIF